ncbi:magnesium-dependent phosphatase 1-like [Metopolophium dirhodum]|uniref:magnesium-dependent phosphatase 1-like n=1 Tax=Metopolophium dirhodum TaxID=44670 RepID=UPI00298F5666|nr:magnesium-dependent phosphatase 1-like [Metopolophium dirhodum]XP_060863224.1 magnesium-dependent phosphatase 1-like [Metopolophium dirhodum]
MAKPSAKSSTRVPKMVVFDLDYTLWPFWVDTHMDPPFHKNGDGKVVDSRGYVVQYYPDTPKVLKYLQEKNIGMSVASRTGETDGAEQLIQLFGWNKYFQNKQIYPGSKVTHINKISKNCNIKLEEMIFFDDEERNIVDVEHLGVVSILIRKGMTMPVLINGLKTFSDIRSNV